MSASQFRAILIWLMLTTAACGQSSSISLTVFPSDSTLHVGQVQTFTAIIIGTNDATVTWSVAEADGGTITEAGVYTAPEVIGIYHIMAIATSKEEQAQTVVKVNVVRHYDMPRIPDVCPSCVRSFCAAVHLIRFKRSNGLGSGSSGRVGAGI